VTFGERIRFDRARVGMKAKDLAAAANVSPQYLNDIERGRRSPPSDDVVERLAKSLGMSPDVLYVCGGRLPPRLRDTDADPETILDALCAFEMTLRQH
jgi:transcriptional regulator with XRE-family HTH domain